MMENMTYYTPPSEEIFEEIKSASMSIWNTYDNQFGYADEKAERIKDIKNVKDNAMYMVAMFDMQNQWKLEHLLSNKANEFIKDRKERGQA